MAKSKFQKKKERERQVRKKILSRRHHKRAEEKEHAKLNAEEKSVRSKQQPIRNEALYAARRFRDEEIRIQLEQNMKLLEGLQKEYEEELKKHEELQIAKIDLMAKATEHLQKVAEKVTTEKK